MSHTDDCPCGRSQDLTFAESSDKFVVDRKTFEELLLLVGWCRTELIKSRFRDCDNFLAALKTCRLSDSPETSDNLEIRKASLLLNYYHDIIPEALTNEDAKQFGKLSKTATWEALLETYGIPLQGVDTVDKAVESKAQSLDTSDWTNDASFPLCNFTPQNSTNFLEWVDFGQLIALALASVGLFVLSMSLWRQINPLNLFPPVKVNIQIGTKL
jgi:hypothetical protein